MNNLPPVTWFTDFWNGVTDEIIQYLVQLSASAGSHYRTNIELKAGYRVELVTQLKYTGDGGWQWLLDTSDSHRIALLQDGTMDTTGFANVMLDGVPYAGGVLTEPTKLHTISFDCDYDTLVNVLMCKNDVTVFNDNILEMLKVYDETDALIVHLDFKQPPGTQFIPNLAGSDFAEAVNIPTDNYLPVTWDSGRNAWVGEEILDSDTASNWEYIKDGSEVNYSTTYFVDDYTPESMPWLEFEIGASYLCSLKSSMTDIPKDRLKLNAVAYSAGSSFVTSGNFTTINKAERTTFKPHIQWWFNLEEIPIGTVFNKPSIKRLIEVV